MIKCVSYTLFLYPIKVNAKSSWKKADMGLCPLKVPCKGLITLKLTIVTCLAFLHVLMTVHYILCSKTSTYLFSHCYKHTLASNTLKTHCENCKNCQVNSVHELHFSEHTDTYKHSQSGLHSLESTIAISFPFIKHLIMLPCSQSHMCMHAIKRILIRIHLVCFVHLTLTRLLFAMITIWIFLFGFLTEVIQVPVHVQTLTVGNNCSQQLME